MNPSLKTKTEILIATWVGRSGPGYWGDSDLLGYDSEFTSFTVSPRGVVAGDPYSYLDSRCRSRRGNTAQ